MSFELAPSAGSRDGDDEEGLGPVVGTSLLSATGVPSASCSFDKDDTDTTSRFSGASTAGFDSPFCTSLMSCVETGSFAETEGASKSGSCARLNAEAASGSLGDNDGDLSAGSFDKLDDWTLSDSQDDDDDSNPVFVTSGCLGDGEEDRDLPRGSSGELDRDLLSRSRGVADGLNCSSLGGIGEGFITCRGSPWETGDASSTSASFEETEENFASGFLGEMEDDLTS